VSRTRRAGRSVALQTPPIWHMSRRSFNSYPTPTLVGYRYEGQCQPPGEDVEFLDEYAKKQGYESRSAVVHKAVRLLRGSELSAAYEKRLARMDGKRRCRSVGVRQR